MNAYMVPACNCPVCGKVLDAASGLNFITNDSMAPTPEDFTICEYCFAILQFDADLRLIRPSEYFLQALEPDQKMGIASMLMVVGGIE